MLASVTTVAPKYLAPTTGSARIIWRNQMLMDNGHYWLTTFILFIEYSQCFSVHLIYALLFHRNYNNYKSNVMYKTKKSDLFPRAVTVSVDKSEREHSLLSLLSAKTCYLNRDFHKLFNKSEILIIFSPQAGLLFWRLAGGRWEGGDYPKYLKNDTGQSEW